MILTTLHKLRSKIPDPKSPVDNVSTIFDDDFYEGVLTVRGINPNAPWNTVQDSVYVDMVVEVFYTILTDLEKVRKLEELGIVRGELDIERKILHLKNRDSYLSKLVFDGPQIP